MVVPLVGHWVDYSVVKWVAQKAELSVAKTVVSLVADSVVPMAVWRDEKKVVM